MDKLKPCPFCGGEANLFIRKTYSDYPCKDEYDIQCLNENCYLCDGADWYFDTKEEAIEKWNRRE